MLAAELTYVVYMQFRLTNSQRYLVVGLVYNITYSFITVKTESSTLQSVTQDSRTGQLVPTLPRSVGTSLRCVAA